MGAGKVEDNWENRILRTIHGHNVASASGLGNSTAAACAPCPQTSIVIERTQLHDRVQSMYATDRPIVQLVYAFAELFPLFDMSDVRV